MLRAQSLLALCDDHNLVRVSFKGLLERNRLAAQILEHGLLQFEAYEMLSVFQSEKIDEQYFIFIKENNYPVIIEIKENYSKMEYEKFSRFSGIPLGKFEAIIEATK